MPHGGTNCLSFVFADSTAPHEGHQHITTASQMALVVSQCAGNLLVGPQTSKRPQPSTISTAVLAAHAVEKCCRFCCRAFAVESCCTIVEASTAASPCPPQLPVELYSTTASTTLYTSTALQHSTVYNLYTLPQVQIYSADAPVGVANTAPDGGG